MSAGAAIRRLAAGLGVLGLSLFLGYNTYKEIMRSLAPLSMELRGEIKGSFPEALLIFAACSLLARTFLKRKDLGAWTVLPLYGAAVNVFAYTKGVHFLFVHNIAIFYFILLSSAAASFSRLAPGPGAANGADGAWWKLARRIAADPSGAFFTLFFVSIASCGALVAFQLDAAAKEMAGLSYFLLLAGLVTDLYRPKRGKGQ